MREAAHSLPVQAGALAAAPKRPIPVLRRVESEGVDRLDVAGQSTHAGKARRRPSDARSGRARLLVGCDHQLGLPPMTNCSHMTSLWTRCWATSFSGPQLAVCLDRHDPASALRRTRARKQSCGRVTAAACSWTMFEARSAARLRWRDLRIGRRPRVHPRQRDGGTHRCAASGVETPIRRSRRQLLRDLRERRDRDGAVIPPRRSRRLRALLSQTLD